MSVGKLFTDTFSDIRENTAALANLSLNPSNGVNYFVDSNAGNDLNDGLSWDKAMKTLTVAMAASHASIAASANGWAARNRIYYKGDGNAESLTTLAQKTDIIGVGSGGGHCVKPSIIGTHTIGAGAFVGCRFFNFDFRPTTAGNNIFTLPATTRGIEFHDCRFDALGGGLAGSAIVATANWFLRIENCEFVGEFSDAAIEILAGNTQGLVIKGCYFEGANEGINIASSVTSTPTKSLIQDNIFHVATKCINDESAIAEIVGNKGTTLQARGLHIAGAVVGNVNLAHGNLFTCADGSDIEYPMRPTINPSGGRDYYVDGNAGHDTNNTGSSWDDAKKSIAVALAASHSNIASGAAGWAARNRVFLKGDAFEENLVLLAQKTDIIGVGSYNQWMKPGILGKHVPISATGIGVRFFNIHFRTATAGDIMTLDSSQRGIEFHDCTFDATADSGNNTGAIIATAVWFLRIKNCAFVGAFSDAAIEIANGNAQGLDIDGNYIEGANQGIDIKSGVTTSPNKGVIRNNVIHTATECINDAADKMVIANNSCVTLQAKGSGGAGAIVGNEFLSVGNKIAASDLANADWPALGTLS